MLRTLHQKLKGLRTSSRSRRRRNPDAPYGVAAKTWTDALARDKTVARSLLSRTREMLVTAGLPAEALPEPFDLNKRADDIATILASSQYPDLAAQSKLDTSSKAVAEQVFSVFDKVAAEKAAKPILAEARRAFASDLDTRRASALAKRKAAGAQVRDAAAESDKERFSFLAEKLASFGGEEEGEEEGEKEGADIDFLYDLSEEALKRQLPPADRKVLLAFVKAKNAGDVDAIRETVGPVRAIADTAPDVPAEAQEPEVSEKRVPRTAAGSSPRRVGQAPSLSPVDQGGARREETPKFEGELSRAGERLAGYDDKRARVRVRTDLPEALRRETKNDILLYVLNDRTTQVWIKGSLTETFVSPSRGKSSWTTAAQYSRKWLETPGATGGPKKSRLGVRVVIAWEGEPDKFEVVVPARTGVGAPAPKKLPPFSTLVEETREAVLPRRPNPFSRQGYFRNPFGRQVVADVREVFRRSNPGGLVTAFVGAAGFVAGTYAEAEFGLSKQFTRGGRATATGAREVARAAQERRLPALPRLPMKPKAKTTSDFKPSTRLDKLLRSFYTLEEQKKRTPFSQAKKREELEDRLDEMWGQIEALKEQEMATQGIRSNPRKLAVPEHIAKTPRKAGERISAIGVKGKWPIGDLFHARLAAIYILSPSHSAKKAQVLRALETNWPQYDWREFLSQRGTLRQVANPSDYETARQMFDLREMKKYGLITTGEYSDGLRYIEEGRGEEYLSYLRKRIAG